MQWDEILGVSDEGPVAGTWDAVGEAAGAIARVGRRSSVILLARWRSTESKVVVVVAADFAGGSEVGWVWVTTTAQGPDGGEVAAS